VESESLTRGPRFAGVDVNPGIIGGGGGSKRITKRFGKKRKGFFYLGAGGKRLRQPVSTGCTAVHWGMGGMRSDKPNGTCN